MSDGQTNANDGGLSRGMDELRRIEQEQNERVAQASSRDAAQFMTVMYGGAPNWYPPPQPYIPKTIPSIAPPTQVFTPVEKRRLRISTMLEAATGELKLKVYLDGELLYEATSQHGTTITVETQV